MMTLVVWLCLFVSMSSATSQFNFSSATFVVMTQRSVRHEIIAEETIDRLKKNLIESGIDRPKIFDLQKDFSVKGSWTFFPIAPKLIESCPDSNWFIFLHETSGFSSSILQDGSV